jgi:type III pantothenate kinase
MQESLLQGTSDIRENRAGFNGILGTTTAECVSGGSVYAVAGAVARILSEMRTELGDAEVYLTGGDAPSLLPLINYPLHYEPDLVLKGLAYVIERHT